jgi:opacity protein-like surface antigen
VRAPVARAPASTSERRSLIPSGITGALLAFFLLAPAGIATAQQADPGFGLGGRLSFVRGDPDVVDSTRYFGGQLRLRGGGRAALEVAFDYRSEVDDLEVVRVVDYPIQASLLAYLIRGAVAPYLLGGVGWYSQRVESLVDGETADSVTTRKVGYHVGFGGDLRLGRRASLHLDYRYTFINIGDSDAPGAILQELLKLSRQGSMWTTGLTVYF